MCRAMMRRWFYNHTESTCRTFYYGGCQGNENRFNTQEECIQECAQPAPVPSSAPSSARTYHGLIREDAAELDEVELDLPILARDKSMLTGDEICAYTVYKTHSELPFKVIVEDAHTGQAKIVLAEGYSLDYERRHRYSFEIAPRDCVSGHHAQKEMVHITVEDVNEFAPQPEQDSYLVNVVEGKLYEEVLRLRVRDQDGSQEFNTICHYHILTPDVPFRIDSDGVLYNTEPLDYSRKRNYILEVRVEDCGKDRSKSSDKVIINVDVQEACKAGWTGIPSTVDYPAGGDTLRVAEQATIDTCDHTCQEAQVSTRAQLTTKHIGKGCDRDTYSIQSQRRMCGADSSVRDLLPSPQLQSWTNTLPTDDGQESDQIFAFDGKTNAIEVPNDTFNHTLGNHFTISTWMKHEEDPEDDSEHGRKEHILCDGDGEKMRRHHYSFFVHNCRLVFLMRQEPDNNDLNVFKPAEWRWKMTQVCDGAWHHYAVSMDFPQVRLYVDGKIFVSNSDNPEVIDDWPLHPAKKVHYTKLSVGACWQGKDSTFAHYFHGYLAGLSVLKGKTESDRVIRCLNDCMEKLDFHAMSEMETGMSVAFNSEMTEITINGHNRTEVEKLVRRIGYVNSRMFPTPGHRSLNLHTTLTCYDGRELSVPDVTTVIEVIAAEAPIITLSGTSSFAFPENDLLTGQYIFPIVRISSQTRRSSEDAGMREDTPDRQSTLYDDDEDEPRYSLDSCMIRAEPPLDLPSEHLSWGRNLAAQLGLEATLTTDGLILSGADRVYNYEEILRGIKYINRQPQDTNTRTFTLTCSELNGRFLSNQFSVRVDVIHTVHHASVPQAHIGDTGMHVESVNAFKELRLTEQDNSKSSFVAQRGSTSVGVTVIVVICVGFLVFMIVLGIFRIRAAHVRTQVVAVDEKPEMEWDNSALTIIVNPMEQEPLYGDCEEGAMGGAMDTDSEDDVSEDYRDDIESSEDEEPTQPKCAKDRGDLEWDDSTLTF